jgi:ankyrin repeat protein
MNRITNLIGAVWLTMFVFTLSLRAGAIHDATATGDLNKVRALLDVDPTLLGSTDGDGNTPLHCACISTPPSFTRPVAVARFLLDQGANVNARNNYGFTPLHLACNGRSPDSELIQRLIVNGADVNARLDRGLTSLHWAASSGDLKAAKLLIDHGADLNAYDNGCYGTPLQMAINSCPKEEMAVLLVERGAKLNQKFSFGNTELHLAALKGYADLARVLVGHGADVNAANEYHHTALYYAAKHGYRRTTDALIAAGAKESSIVETNNGKAPQLAATLKEGEAYLWYLDGLYGGGYAVKTKGHLVLFDKMGIDESPEAALANGHLNPDELAGQKITVLITKATGLAHESRVCELAKRIPGIDVVFDSKPTASDMSALDITPCHLAAPHESLAVGGIQIHPIPAMGRGYGGAQGLGYLVEADGLKILHAGFHASGNEAAETARYRKEIDFLKPCGPIDIAILTVSGHLAADYEPYLYLIDQLSPKAVYLMGGDAATEEYPRCVEVLRARNVPVAYPEGGIAMGERFHFVREQASAAAVLPVKASPEKTK